MEHRVARLATLAVVLRYRNARVIDDFSARFKLPRLEATALFKDVLRFLWLTARAEQLGYEGVPVLGAQLLFDEMWHTFILRTRDYHEFCTRYFGGYRHHTPGSKRKKWAPTPEKQLDRLLDLVIDELGPETAVRWYETYPRRYPPERMDRLLRPYAPLPGGR